MKIPAKHGGKILEQVKSKDRVADHGEVFTSEREVKAMCDLVEDECLRIDSRFLEPACGNGNFLYEILDRKLKSVTRRYKKSPYDWTKNSILALSSIYGVEILYDNVDDCRERLFELWNNYFESVVKKSERDQRVRDSAKFILSKNIILGNALSLYEVDENGNDIDKPIVFSNWSFVTGAYIKREDYIFSKLLDGTSEEKKNNSQNNQLSFDLFGSDESNQGGTLIQIYPPVDFRELGNNG